MPTLEPAYPLTTERLRLRPFEASDLDALHAIHSREDIARHLYWNARTRNEVRDVLAKKTTQRAIRSEGDTLAVAAVLASSGEVIGDCILTWVSRDHAQGEIGFVFHPEHHGRG